ncbi:hypothetical protein [Antarctobacter jejuensis]|uniref:hypothetical protein n=1 Tax=Antarctobacter jejuensis TaxID=1439938 RepID=UPI003FCF1775
MRTDPALADSLSIWVHLMAIGLTLVGTVVFGYSLGMSATSVAWVSEGLAAVLAAIGFVLTFSVLFSWMGHLPGAVALHYALRSGHGGWAVAMAGGLAIGGVLSVLIGSILAAFLGPFLAVIHLAFLRALATRFRASAERVAPNPPGGRA